MKHLGRYDEVAGQYMHNCDICDVEYYSEDMYETICGPCLGVIAEFEDKTEKTYEALIDYCTKNNPQLTESQVKQKYKNSMELHIIFIEKIKKEAVVNDNLIFELIDIYINSEVFSGFFNEFLTILYQNKKTILIRELKDSYPHLNYDYLPSNYYNDTSTENESIPF